MKSLRILLDQLIDYAGLFPPAGLPMELAVSNFAAYRKGRHSWALGRFVVPASRLSEFEKTYSNLFSGSNADPSWRLCVLAGIDLAVETRSILDFNEARSRLDGLPAIRIDTVEIKVSSREEVIRAARLLPSDLQAYFEIPIAGDPAPLIAEIARAGAHAKVRTGGLTPDSIPPAAALARFLSACSAVNLPFKATAGLHHPVRSNGPLGYEEGSPRGTMHGFLNVFLASAFLRTGLEEAEAIRLLEDQSVASFGFEEAGARWRAHRISAEQLADVRRHFAVSFGSCSFEEPVGELRLLNFLD